MTGRAMRGRAADALEAVRDAQQALGCAMYRLDYPFRYRWLRLTFRRKQALREEQEYAAWLSAIYGRGPFPGYPSWVKR